MLCGAPSGDPDSLREMKEKFGNVLIEIRDMNAFASVIGRHLASSEYKVKDVIYIDGKYMSIQTNDLDDYLDRFGSESR